jgi:hypothetical protein
MDSDQVHTALMGLDIVVSASPDVQFVRGAHEKHEEEDDSCGG